MKKKLLVVLALLAAAVAGVLVSGAMQPEKYHVERSVMIAAPPDVVYAALSDFRRFPEWSPWEKMDPGMTRTMSSPSSGVGASYAWKGEKVGEGRMTIVSAKPNELVDIKLEFLKPWESTAGVKWTVKPEGALTKVTWGMDGNNNGLMAKTFSMFMNMDKMIGKDFESGLAALKVLSEKDAKNPPATPRAAEAPTPK